MPQEIYVSSTYGPIALSFTGRRLLANLREATFEAIQAKDVAFNDNALSKARARLALYMSSLEQKHASALPS